MGSRPYMLRVTPDGRYLWVQTAAANTNVVLDTDTMEVLQTTPTGRGPVSSAVARLGERYGLITHTMEPYVLVLDADSGQEVTRVEVGGTQTTVSFTPDGSRAFVAVTPQDEVVAIDMRELAVAGRIPTSPRPFGLLLLQA